MGGLNRPFDGCPRLEVAETRTCPTAGAGLDARNTADEQSMPGSEHEGGQERQKSGPWSHRMCKWWWFIRSN